MRARQASYEHTLRGAIRSLRHALPRVSEVIGLARSGEFGPHHTVRAKGMRRLHKAKEGEHTL